MQTNYEKAKEEGIKEFDKQFGIAVRYSDGDLACSEGRTAGCDDCYSNIELREEHRNFLSSFAEKIKEGVEKDTSDEINHAQRILLDGFAHPKDCKMCPSDSQTIKE